MKLTQSPLLKLTALSLLTLSGCGYDEYGPSSSDGAKSGHESKAGKPSAGTSASRLSALKVDYSKVSALGFTPLTKKMAMGSTQGDLASASPQVETKSSEFYLLNNDGTTTSVALEGFQIEGIKGFDGGFLMQAKDLTQTNLQSDLYFVRTIDQRIFVVQQTESTRLSLSDFVGQADQKDLVFRDGRKIDFETASLGRLPINLEDAQVSSISGNFLQLYSLKQSLSQIYDLSSNKRFNAESEFIALSENRVLIRYADLDRALLDIPSSTRMVSNVSWYFSATRVKDGMISLTNQCNQKHGLASGMYLTFVDFNGQCQILLTDAFVGALHQVTFYTSGDLIVWKELNGLSVLRRGEKKAQKILSDLNILEVEVAGGYVYYRAESFDGEFKGGVYDLTTGHHFPMSKGQKPFEQIEVIAMK